MAKIVIRSPLERMPTHQKQALLAWLTTGGPDCVGISYDAACKRLLQEFGVRSSASAMYEFRRRHTRSTEPLVEQKYDQNTGRLTLTIHLHRK